MGDTKRRFCHVILCKKSEKIFTSLFFFVLTLEFEPKISIIHPLVICFSDAASTQQNNYHLFLLPLTHNLV